jgi:hypothetical protein
MLIVFLQQSEDQSRFVIQLCGEPPGGQLDSRRLQRQNLAFKSCNVFGSIIVSQPPQSEFAKHCRALLGRSLLRVEGNNAPCNESLSSEGVADLGSRLLGIRPTRHRQEKNEQTTTEKPNCLQHEKAL